MRCPGCGKELTFVKTLELWCCEGIGHRSYTEHYNIYRCDCGNEFRELYRTTKEKEQ